MGIGLGVTLLVLGAILYFTNLDSRFLNTNLNTVGIILMAGGALSIILGLVMNAQRTRTQHTTVSERRGAPDLVERRADDDVVVERPVERPVERIVERPADRVDERPSDRTVDRTTDRGGRQERDEGL